MLFSIQKTGLSDYNLWGRVKDILNLLCFTDLLRGQADSPLAHKTTIVFRERKPWTMLWAGTHSPL